MFLFFFFFCHQVILVAKGEGPFLWNTLRIPLQRRKRKIPGEEQAAAAAVAEKRLNLEVKRNTHLSHGSVSGVGWWWRLALWRRRWRRKAEEIGRRAPSAQRRETSRSSSVGYWRLEPFAAFLFCVVGRESGVCVVCPGIFVDAIRRRSDFSTPLSDGRSKNAMMSSSRDFSAWLLTTNKYWLFTIIFVQRSA